jgi:hypothetical protein
LLSFAQREQRKGFLYGVFMAEPELNFIAPHPCLPACLCAPPARCEREREVQKQTAHDVQTTPADESKFAEMRAGLNGEATASDSDPHFYYPQTAAYYKQLLIVATGSKQSGNGVTKERIYVRRVLKG